MNKPERLFWAINLPGELKEKLHKLQKQLDIANNAVKWVKPQNYHLTIKFLGDTDPAVKNDLVQAVFEGLKRMKCFELNVSGLGFFPANSTTPRIFWAGLGGDLDCLAVLFHQVEKAVLPFGYPQEHRKFSPHLTLARMKQSKETQDLVAAVKKMEIQALEFGSFKVSAVDLMGSELFPQGPVYRIVKSIKLN